MFVHKALSLKLRMARFRLTRSSALLVGSAKPRARLTPSACTHRNMLPWSATSAEENPLVSGTAYLVLWG